MGVPEGWESVQLGDLTAGDERRLTDGDWIESKDQDPEGTIRLLQVGNVLTGTMKLGGTHRWVNQETAKRLNCTFLREGDILIARLPDPLGRAARVPELPYDAITAVDCAIFRPDSSLADSDFAVQFLNSDGYFAEVLTHATGTTRRRISRKNLATLNVLLPPLPEQRKIAAILSSVDEAIEATQAVIDQVQVVKKGLMQELLTKGLPGRHKKFKQTEVGQIPEEWEVVELQSVGRIQTGAAKNKKNGGALDVPYLRVANVQDGYVDLTDMKTLSVNADALSRYGLRSGYVLFTEGGDADKLGRGTVWDGSIDPCLHQNHVFAVEVDHRRLNPWFLSFWGGSERGKAYFLDSAKQTTNLASINSSQLKALPLPLPPLDEQEDIVARVESVRSRIDAESANLSQLQEVKQALMSVLLTGELRVQPNEGLV